MPSFLPLLCRYVLPPDQASIVNLSNSRHKKGRVTLHGGYRDKKGVKMKILPPCKSEMVVTTSTSKR